MDTEEEKEVRDRGEAGTAVRSPLPQPCLPAFPRRQAKRTGYMLACPRPTLPRPIGPPAAPMSLSARRPSHVRAHVPQVALLPLEALEQPVTLGCGHSFELQA